MLLILVAGVALLYVARAQVSPPTAVLTPIPIATATATAATTAPSTTNAPPATPQAGATAEQAADTIATALQTSDFAALERLIVPTGFDWAKSGSGGLTPKTSQEAVEFLRTNSGGRLQVMVTPRPLKTSPVPWGPLAIDSVWTNYGNVPSQKIALVLREVSGKWYWVGGYIT